MVVPRAIASEWYDLNPLPASEPTAKVRRPCLGAQLCMWAPFGREIVEIGTCKPDPSRRSGKACQCDYGCLSCTLVAPRVTVRPGR
jgi:hypothetical protein